MKGAVNVIDADGNGFGAERALVALCRCGGLDAKPFYDGTHSRFGFRAAERAVHEEEERD